MSTWPAGEHRLRLPLAPRQVLARVARAARMWGAEWSRSGNGGELALPVVAGIRRGVLDASVAVAADGAESELVLDVRSARMHVHTQALAILLLAAAGGVTAMLWPFWPELLPLVPVGAILALSAWFLVVSRLRTSGPADFLELVERLGGEGSDEPEDA